VLYDSLLTLTKKSVLRIRDVYPGYELFNPRSWIRIFLSRVRIFPTWLTEPNLSIPDPGSKRHRIPDPEFFHPGSGSRQKGIGSRIQTRKNRRNPRRRRETELYSGRLIDLDEEMLEGDCLVCVVVHVGVPEVGEYSQLSRHCINREINQSDSEKVIKIAKKRALS
jgi:hypothetical protein